MEAKLVETSVEVFNPDVNPILRNDGELDRRRGSLVESEAHSFGEDGRFRWLNPIGFISDLKLKLVSKRRKVLVGIRGLVVLRERDKIMREDNFHLPGWVFVEVEQPFEAQLVGFDRRDDLLGNGLEDEVALARKDDSLHQ